VLIAKAVITVFSNFWFFVLGHPPVDDRQLPDDPFTFPHHSLSEIQSKPKNNKDQSSSSSETKATVPFVAVFDFVYHVNSSPKEASISSATLSRDSYLNGVTDPHISEVEWRRGQVGVDSSSQRRTN